MSQGFHEPGQAAINAQALLPVLRAPLGQMLKNMQSIQ